MLLRVANISTCKRQLPFDIRVHVFYFTVCTQPSRLDPVRSICFSIFFSQVNDPESKLRKGRLTSRTQSLSFSNVGPASPPTRATVGPASTSPGAGTYDPTFGGLFPTFVASVPTSIRCVCVANVLLVWCFRSLISSLLKSQSGQRSRVNSQSGQSSRVHSQSRESSRATSLGTGRSISLVSPSLSLVSISLVSPSLSLVSLTYHTVPP